MSIDFSTEVRVYLEDTDAGGIVYHASYLRFMERARTELLRLAGFEQSRTFTDGVSFVVHKMRLRFRGTARLDDRLQITCALREVRAASLHFEQRVLRLAALPGEAPWECVAAAVGVACISLDTGRARRIPRELIDVIRREQG